MLVAVVVVEGLASLISFLLLGEVKFFQLCKPQDTNTPFCLTRCSFVFWLLFF